jgi:hypothetical protein
MKKVVAVALAGLAIVAVPATASASSGWSKQVARTVKHKIGPAYVGVFKSTFVKRLVNRPKCSNAGYTVLCIGTFKGSDTKTTLVMTRPSLCKYRVFEVMFGQVVFARSIGSC